MDYKLLLDTAVMAGEILLESRPENGGCAGTDDRFYGNIG